MHLFKLLYNIQCFVNKNTSTKVIYTPRNAGRFATSLYIKKSLESGRIIESNECVKKLVDEPVK